MGHKHSKPTKSDQSKSNSNLSQLTLPSLRATPSEKNSSSTSSYAKEVASYQYAVYGNPRPSHQILSQLHFQVHSAQDSNNPESDDAKMQDAYASSIAVLTTFWENHVNILSDDEYDTLALTFYTNVYTAIPEAHHIFKSRVKRSASMQSKIFLGMFGWLVNAVSHPDSSHRLTRKLSVLGQLHEAMGVTLPYYLKMGGAFHRTMEDKFDQRYTLRVRFCFNTLYEIVVYIMIGVDFRSQCIQQKGKISAFMEHINDLRCCLDDDDTLEYLTLFMKHQFCEELALYYKDYKAYKCCANQQQRDAKGKEMKRLYIAPASEREINISWERTKAFNESLSSTGYDANIFDQISKDVVQLIQNNCFSAFKQEIHRVYDEMNANKDGGGKGKKSPKKAYAQNWNFLVNRLNQTADPEEP